MKKKVEKNQNEIPKAEMHKALFGSKHGVDPFQSVYVFTFFYILL